MAGPAVSREKWTFDWVLLAIVLCTAGVGLANLRSASLVDGTNHWLTQLVWLLIGSGIAAFITLQDYRLFERWAYLLYGAGVFLLLLLPFVGVTINNSTRWLNLGVSLYQPSESMKLALVVAIARYFHDHEAAEGHRFRELLVPFAIVGLPFVLVLQQPDLGTALILLFIFGTVLLFERVSRGTLVGLVAVAIVAIPIMWFFVMEDYQKGRVISFLYPDEHLAGDAWQVTQSQIAIGSGRILGKGYLRGTQVQNGFVPYHETDFIFAHHGEQFGFVGSVVLLLLYLALILWALRVARWGRDRFAVLTAVGLAAFIFWHVLVNIGMVTGMLPVVGLWLPFASYGGSATLTVMIAVGLLMSISTRRHVF